MASPAIEPGDFSRGVLQAIGYKEFREWFQWREADGASTAPSDEAVLLQEAVDRTKTATRAYIRAQLQWIRKRLIPQAGYRLDGGPASVESPRCLVWPLDVSPVLRGDRSWDDAVLAEALAVSRGASIPPPCPPVAAAAATTAAARPAPMHLVCWWWQPPERGPIGGACPFD